VNSLRRDSYTQALAEIDAALTQLAQCISVLAGQDMTRPEVMVEESRPILKSAIRAAHGLHDGPNGAPWIGVQERLPENHQEVLLYHCLGDSRRGMHAYDVATYSGGRWIFPWDRGELNPKPRWAIAWMPIPKHSSDDATHGGDSNG
jgi:hypothetical protein